MDSKAGSRLPSSTTTQPCTHHHALPLPALTTSKTTSPSLSLHHRGVYGTYYPLDHLIPHVEKLHLVNLWLPNSR